MTDIRAGGSIQVSHHRILDILECEKCHCLFVKADPQDISVEDAEKLNDVGLRLGNTTTHKDLCIDH